MTNSTQVLSSTVNNITTLTINRPEKRNALNDELIDTLANELEQIAVNQQTRVLILTGAGQHFCAGADLAWMKEISAHSDNDHKKDAARLTRLLNTLFHCPIPTIAQINGSAFGGGVGLISACDFAVCVKESVFCLSETRLGLTPSTISPYLNHKMGPVHALQHSLLAQPFDADTAKTTGLVDLIANNLSNAVLALAKQLADNGPSAIREIKQLARSLSGITPEHLTMAEASLVRARKTTEAQEGIQAFFEKRAPSWRNS